MSTERDWDELSLDEKLTELGFERDPAKEFDIASKKSQERLHAALDQLMDAGGLLNEIEVIVKPVAEGVVGADVHGELVEKFKRIHEMLKDEE